MHVNKQKKNGVCLIVYVPVNNFQLCWDGSSWVEPVLSTCLRTQHIGAQVRLEPWPLGLESITLPLSLCAP